MDNYTVMYVPSQTLAPHYHGEMSLFQHDVIGCAQQVEMLESQLAARMEQLQATVQSKTAVPTAQVYVSNTLLLIHVNVMKY